MNRDELAELHYIAPISNVASILRRGIVSHRQAVRLQHQTVAMQEIQERRAKVRVPGARFLHEYVNLYFCARNPMLYKRRAEHAGLCVLRVDTAVLDLPGVVIADRNASSDHVRFGAAPQAISLVDRNLVFAEVWTHPEDRIMEWRHRSIKCAEVLVPDRIGPEYIVGAYASGDEGGQALVAVASGLAVTMNAPLFFR